MAEGGTARLLRLTKVRNCQFIQALAGWTSSATAICAMHRTKPTRESVSEDGMFLLADIGRRFTESTTWGTSGSGGLMRSLSANQRRASLQSRPNQSACQKV